MRKKREDWRKGGGVEEGGERRESEGKEMGRSVVAAMGRLEGDQGNHCSFRQEHRPREMQWLVWGTHSPGRKAGSEGRAVF